MFWPQMFSRPGELPLEKVGMEDGIFALKYKSVQDSVFKESQLGCSWQNATSFSCQRIF